MHQTFSQRSVGVTSEAETTVTALAFENKREHPNQVKGFVETVVPNYCDPKFASHFRMKRTTFQVKDNPLLTSETVL